MSHSHVFLNIWTIKYIGFIRIENKWLSQMRFALYIHWSECERCSFPRTRIRSFVSCAISRFCCRSGDACLFALVLYLRSIMMKFVHLSIEMALFQWIFQCGIPWALLSGASKEKIGIFFESKISVFRLKSSRLVAQIDMHCDRFSKKFYNRLRYSKCLSKKRNVFSDNQKFFFQHLNIRLWKFIH